MRLDQKFKHKTLDNSITKDGIVNIIFWCLNCNKCGLFEEAIGKLCFCSKDCAKEFSNKRRGNENGR